MRKALIVGIDHYEHVGTLSGCVNDAHAVEAVLERHADGTLNFAAPNVLTGGSVQGCLVAITNCLTFTTAKDEKYLTVTSVDASGRPVGISLYPNTGVNGASTETFICGSAKDFPIPPKSDWNLAADTLTADVACPGVASRGTVTIVLSNLP